MRSYAQRLARRYCGRERESSEGSNNIGKYQPFDAFIEISPDGMIGIALAGI